MAQISYTNKVALNVNPEIADINKVTDNDMNEIKSVVNDNYNKTIQITDTQPTDNDNKIWIDNGEIQNVGSEIAININEPTHGEQVWLQPSKNLFDGAIELGTISSETGENNKNNNRKRSKNYTEVLPNTTYTISFDQEVAVIIFEYASDKSYIGRLPNNDTWGDQPFTFTTSATTKYVRFATYTTLENKAQIELGNVATTITPKENKIYTNQHGEYNTFYDSGNVENYSIAEQRIGTWIDGKPLYRRIVETTVPTTSADGTDATEGTLVATNIAMNIIEWGYIQMGTTDTRKRALPFITSSGYRISMTSNTGNTGANIGSNYIGISNNYASYSGKTAVFSVIYTKND